MTAQSASDVGAQTRRRITLRLMPFLFLLYLVSYLDRVNVSYASLEMTRDLRFSNKVFGFGSGIFFLGYLLLEIPGAILVERWSARKWIARILISWGFFATLTGLVHTAHEFYGARFMLGLAEAGFFPGVLVYRLALVPAGRSGESGRVLHGRNSIFGDHRRAGLRAVATGSLAAGLKDGAGFSFSKARRRSCWAS